MSAAVASYDQIKDLPLEIDSYELQGLEFHPPGTDFDRLTTIIHLKGGDQEGLGEDVVYDSLDHIAFQDAGPALDIAGQHTIASFSELLEGLGAVPEPAGKRGLGQLSALGVRERRPRPRAAPGGQVPARGGRARAAAGHVRRLDAADAAGSDEVSTIEPVRKRLEIYPTLRFKLDPTNDWTDELIQQLVETGAVDSLDLKGQYKGTPVDVETDPGALPEADRGVPRRLARGP